jgi:hypothetical protein
MIGAIATLFTEVVVTAGCHAGSSQRLNTRFIAAVHQEVRGHERDAEQSLPS